jgi:predicted GH43/DUF377 family glycosyl hydrolase
MQIEKKGIIFKPDKSVWWQQHYAILPTPYYISELGIIRVFFASTCKEKYGRLTYIDLDSTNPSRIISSPLDFILDIGEEGSFDDCGINPSSILKVRDKFYLYFAGYQRHIRTPYSIFSGLAISDDLHNFKKYSKTPILDRTDSELSLRSAPSVLELNDKYYMVYVSDYGWSKIDGEIFNGKKMPKYCLKSGISNNGIDWEVKNEPIIFPLSEDEFGFGRPYLFKNNNLFYLFYSIRKKNISYRIGYAISKDNCQTWERKDDIVGLDVSSFGWDSEMICYGAPIKVEDIIYFFYNGNNNGETGFGYAEIINL